MTHLNELCSKPCVFDSSNPVEFDNACAFCWVSQARLIEPALQAIIGGKEGEVYGEYNNQYIVRTKMSNGEWSNSSVYKSQVNIK